jgi:hypothetical protein
MRGNDGVGLNRRFLKESLIKSFDKLRMNGNLLIPFVVSLSNHEQNKINQHFPSRINSDAVVIQASLSARAVFLGEVGDLVDGHFGSGCSQGSKPSAAAKSSIIQTSLMDYFYRLQGSGAKCIAGPCKINPIDAVQGRQFVE